MAPLCLPLPLACTPDRPTHTLRLPPLSNSTSPQLFTLWITVEGYNVDEDGHSPERLFIERDAICGVHIPRYVFQR